MAKINVVMLFNGTGDADTDPNTTNVVKFRDGLIQDKKQFVLYRDGIGNDKQWGPWTRWFADMTGFGARWVMNEAYDDLIKKINLEIKNGTIKKGDTLSFSFNGFSRGSALARHFANKYINEHFVHALKGHHRAMDIKVEIAGEYLFDTVPAFELPWLRRILEGFLQFIGYKKKEPYPGWDFHIPKGTKAYHAVSIDEPRKPFIPWLIDRVKGETEEVWFDGVHSDVGGSFAPPKNKKDAVLADVNPMRYMVNRAKTNGLRFSPEFSKNYHLSKTKTYPLGIIHHNPGDEISEGHGPREIKVIKEGKPSKKSPIIHESAIRRLKKDSNYRSDALKSLDKFKVFSGQGTLTKYSSEDKENLWNSLPPPSKVLTFRAKEKMLQKDVENVLGIDTKDTKKKRKSKVV